MTKHYIVKCSACGAVVTQCRCIGPHGVRWVDGCPACGFGTKAKTPETHINESPLECLQNEGGVHSLNDTECWACGDALVDNYTGNPHVWYCSCKRTAGGSP